MKLQPDINYTLRHEGEDAVRLRQDGAKNTNRKSTAALTNRA